MADLPDAHHQDALGTQMDRGTDRAELADRTIPKCSTPSAPASARSSETAGKMNGIALDASKWSIWIAQRTYRRCILFGIW